MNHEWNPLPKRDALAALLKDLNLPEMRKDLTKIANIRWLNRNISINNKGPDVDKARALIVDILRENR